MNIIPFVLSFLVVLSMISMSFFRSAAHSHLLAHEFQRHMVVKRNLLNDLDQAAYKKRLPPQKGQKQSKTETKKKEYISPRKESDLSENAKFNLLTLVNKPKGEDRFLKSGFKRFIVETYSEKAFFAGTHSSPGEIADQLIDHMIKKAQSLLEADEDIELTDLFPSREPLKSIYYHMLRGTGKYDIQKGSGSPPLGDYVFLSKEEKRKALCLKKAALPLLRAFFSPSFVETLLQKEKEKYYSNAKGSSILTEDEFRNLLAMTKFAGNSTSILNDMQFYYSKAQKETHRRTDPSSGITVTLQSSAPKSEKTSHGQEILK